MTNEGEPPMRGQPEMTRPGSLITDRELADKIAELEKRDEGAGGVGTWDRAKMEWLQQLRKEARRRVEKANPKLFVSSPFEHLSDNEIMDMIADLAGNNVRAVRSIQGWLIGELEGELRRRNPKG